MSDAGPPQGARDPSGGSEDTPVPSVGALVVLDTNIALDAFVFSDVATLPLRAGLEDGSLQWIATPDMRIELARVLGYPQIVPRLAFYGLEAADVLAGFDRHARLVEAAPKAPVTCSDPDDQKFIDLAVAHQCALLSKDRAVLDMRKRLLSLGVWTGPAFENTVA
jgi:predicted nucleic acid-binding protein